MPTLAEQILDGVKGRSTGSPYTDSMLEALITRTYDPSGYEAVELEHFLSVIKGCDLFIDLGANSGRYTYTAAQHLHQAKIISIEANVHLIPLLESLVEILKQEHPDNSYRVEHAAILDKPGEIEFFVDASPTVGSVFANERGQPVKVKAATLDSFYEPARMALIKVDVEGAEYRVLHAAQRFIASKHCTFLVELHGWGDEAAGKYPVHVLLYMASRGYAVRKADRHHFFHRAGALQVWATCAMAFPDLLVKYIVYRYLRKFVPVLRRLRARYTERPSG